MNINTILRRTIIGALFFVPFIPLIVAPSMFFPFITGKNFAFRILVEIMFALWLILAYREPGYRPKFSWVLAAVAVFVGVITLADFLGENVYKSFWSNFERMEGLITIWHLGAYMLVAGTMLSTERLWSWFAHASIVASAIVSAFSISQLLKDFALHQGSRLDATLGNASYLAVYMLFHIFILAFLLFRRHSGPQFVKWLYGALMLVELVVLYYTATRGTILGLIGGSLLAALLVMIFGKEYPRMRKATAGIFIGILVLIGAFLAVKNTDFVKMSPVLSRFAKISASEVTTQSRFIIWGMSIQGFKEHPILGWGQENYNFVFNKYFDPRLWRQEAWFDRSHNIFFDWLIAGGLLGLLSYLSLFGAIFYYVWRKGADNHFSLLDKSILTGLFAGYFFHNFFVFDNLISYMLFFSVLAYMHWVARETSQKEESIAAGRSEAREPNAGMIFGPVVIIVLAFVLYTVNIKGILTAETLLQALQSQPEGPQKNLELYETALSYGTFGNSETREQLIQAASQAADLNISPELKQKFAVLARDEMQKQIKAMPNDARYQIFMASFLNRTSHFDDAIPYAERAIALSPKKQAMYFEFATSYLNKKEYDKALDILKTAFELDPTYGKARLVYAMAAIYGGHNDIAEQILLPEYGTMIIDSDQLLGAYAATKQYGKVIAIWKLRLKDAPNNPQYHLSLGASYLQAGERGLAVSEIQKVIDLNPQFKDQGEYYIREIKAGRNP
ncbi:MAG: O-antigen ligase family protein [Candidatus Lloydbacteria bacterium]|nr:O-antigen ligase family protein [Candidatus Lloydbacteria bacterium]